MRPGSGGQVTGSGDQVTSLWRGLLLAGVAAVFTLAQAGPSDAQFFFRDAPARDVPTRVAPNRDAQPRKAPKRVVAPVKKKKDVAIRHPFGENMPKGPLQLVVSISDQRAFLYSNGVRVGETKVSTGTHSHPTPTGVFSIIQKNRWHRSNLYGNAPMFYMHRLTWSGIALHEGALPGYAASHGCIRMPTDFVSRLWNVSRMGMRVVVVRNVVAPREFAHAKLFNPAQKPPDNPTRVSATEGLRSTLDTATPAAVNLIRVAEAQPITGEPIVTSDVPPVAASAPTSNAPVSSTSLHETAAPQTAAHEAAPAAAPEAASASAAPETAPTAAEPPAVTAEPVTTTAPAAATATTVTAPPAPEPVTTSTVTAPPAARAVVPPAAPTATPAATSTEPERPAIDLEELRLPRPAPLRTRSAEPQKLNGQVAVFISRKEKRLFVRHAFVPLFDVPIEIENPDKPFGTHTYTALEVVDGVMRWNVISLAPAGLPPVRNRAAKNAPKQQQKLVKGKKGAPAPVLPVNMSDATEALDRVSIPPEAVERISELLIPGSSLIISDEGLGRETGRYTEFIVETRH